MRNKVSKLETSNLTKLIEEIKKKTEKEINSYVYTINQKDKKLHEYELKIHSLENKLRTQIDEYASIKQDYNPCKDKIPGLKYKQDLMHKSKFGYENEEELNSMKENSESTLTMRDKEIKNFVREISDLSENVEKMRKFENLLKDKLNIKDRQLSKSNEIIHSSQNENEKISEENIQLKKQISSLNNQFLNGNMNELKTQLNDYKHNILLMKEENENFKKKIERKSEINMNKSEQNYSMVDLLKVIKKELSLLQDYIEPNNDLKIKLQELKDNEIKVLVVLQKITDEQLSESEPEYEEGINLF